MATTTVDTSMWGLYVFEANDGSLTVVDASGKAIASPPTVEVGPDGSFNVLGTAGQPATGSDGGPITLPAYTPPIYNVYAYTTSDGSVTIVDASGNPVPIPPDLKTAPGGGLVVVDGQGQVIEDAGGPVEVPPYVSPTFNVYVYTGSDGTTKVVDAAGKPITSPPLVDAKGGLVDGSGAAVIDPVTGAQATIPAYSPPTFNVYVYTGSDGTTKVVDAAGKPITSPPLVDAKGGLVDGSGVAVIDPVTGAQATIPAYSPPTTGIYVHDYPMLHVVDAAGKPIPSPPNVGVMAGKGPLLFDTDGNPLLDSNGDVIPVPRYMPETWGEYAQVVTDPTTGYATVTLVDAAGNPLPSQPKTYLAKEGDSWVVNIKDPTKLDPANMNDDMLTDGSGNPVTVPIWDPTSVPRLLVYVSADGTPQVVDATGKPVVSPPNVSIHPFTGQPIVHGAGGQPIVDENGSPLTLPLYSPPTQGIYAHVVTDPATGAISVQMVDAAGNLVPSPPGYVVQRDSLGSGQPPKVTLTDANGDTLLDEDGKPVTAPLYSPPTQGIYAHVVTDPATGAISVQMVDAAGNLVPSPPGYVVQRDSLGSGQPPKVTLTDANGDTLLDEDGKPVTAPLYSPPTQGIYAHVVTDPATGAISVQMVDAAGNLVPSPPGYVVQRDSLGSGQPPKVTLTDANGDTLLDEDGKPVTAPLYSPPTQGIYAHVVTDPATGAISVQMVDAAGNLVPSPPGYVVQRDSLGSGQPPKVTLTDANGDTLLDEDGKPVTAPLYSPPTQGIYAHVIVSSYTDPVTGDVEPKVSVQMVDAAGNLVPSPPGYTVQMDMSDPSAVPKVTLTDANGDTVLDEDGKPITVPLHPSSATPPGAAPPVEEEMEGEAEVEIPFGETDETEEASGAGEAEAPGEPDEAEASTEAPAIGEQEQAGSSERRAAEPDVDVESDEAELTGRTGSVRPEIVADERSGDAGPPARMESARQETVADEVTAPEVDQRVEIGAVDMVGPVGLGAEELVEIVSGRGEPSVEAAAEEGAGTVADMEPIIDIPEIELDGKGMQPYERDDIAFKVEMASAEAAVEVESSRGGESPLTEAEPPEFKVAETTSPVGLGAAELVELIAEPGKGSGEEAPGVVAVPPFVEESVLEIPDASPAADADDFAGIEGKVIPVLELEGVEFKVEMAQFEVELVGFQVEVAEAGTLQEEELEVSDLRGASDEPTEEAIGRMVLAEEEDEPDEPAR